MKYISTWFIILCLPLLGRSQQLPDSVITKLRTGVAGFMERYHSPSMVVVLVHDSSIIFSDARGYADQEKKIAATIDYPYPLLSISKVFTATMYMQLRARGKLLLEDDVRKYLPEFNNGSLIKNKSGVSLLQLAMHTSGLPRNTHADIVFAKQVDEWIINRRPLAALMPATKEQLLHSLPAIRTEYPAYKLLPYSDRLYSNLGYCMLGIAAERVAKMDYADYVRANIFKPLKMRFSGFDSEPAKPVLAVGYYYDDSSKSFIPTPPFHSNGAVYAGGMYATARDLAKFISFQFDTSRAAERVLPASDRAMMASLRIGWKPDYPLVYHEGAMLGYRCVMAWHPELKIGWVILTNTSEFEFSRINRYFADLLTPVFAPKTLPGLQKFVGLYQLEDGGDSIRIHLEDGKLYSTYLAGYVPSSPLTVSGNYNFRGAGRGVYSILYDFIADAEGKILYLNLGQLKWVKK